MRIAFDDLRQFCSQVLQKLDVSKEAADATADVLVTSDLFDIASHGLARLKRYVGGIESGQIVPNMTPIIEKESPTMVLVDAQNGLGQPAGVFAMEKAIEKVKPSGMCFATVKHSNHYGIAGYYALMAAREGLLGISMTNSNPLVVPTNGKAANLGTNPFSFAVPVEGDDPFLMDMATSRVARGTLEVFHRREKEIPDGWALDEKGNQTHNPGLVLKNLLSREGGGLMPLGGYKGLGLAMMVDIFTGVLSGAAYSTDVSKHGTADIGHTFLVIDVSQWMDLNELRDRMNHFKELVKTAPRDEAGIRIPGEQTFDSARKNREYGVPIEQKVVENLQEIGGKYGVEFPGETGHEAFPEAAHARKSCSVVSESTSLRAHKSTSQKA